MVTTLKGFALSFALLALVGCAHFLESNKTPDEAKLHLQISIERFNAREYNRAIEACTKALELNPDMAEAHNHMALIYMETKRYQKSFEAFQKALKVKPQNPEVFNNLGVLYNRQDKYSEAIPYFQKALADTGYLTPENAYTNMGYSHFRMGQLTTAKTYHQKALDIVPNFCLAGKNLGDVYVKERLFTQAEKHFRKAVRNCPLYQEARYKLGLVLVKMGDRKTAKLELDKLLKQHKEGAYVDRTQEVLKYLQ
jgi:type IV pilus assembly protein PilF